MVRHWVIHLEFTFLCPPSNGGAENDPMTINEPSFAPACQGLAGRKATAGKK